MFDRNLLVQDRVNDHLLIHGETPMSSIDYKTPRSITEPAMACAGAKAPTVPVSADRLYRIAAMTAGIVFLATLL